MAVKTIKRRLVLTGARTGLTCMLGKLQFTEGKLTLILPEPEMENIGRYLARVYAAYPEGSPELARQQERDKLNPSLKELYAGEVHPDSGGNVHGGGEPHGERPAASSADDGSAAAGAASAAAEHGADGDGQQHTRDDKIREVVASLDPDNDEHWTADGRPRIDIVAKLVGDPTIGRKDVETAAAGSVRKG